MSYFGNGQMNQDALGSVSEAPNNPMAMPTAEIIRPQAPANTTQFAYDNILNTPAALEPGSQVYDLTQPSPTQPNPQFDYPDAVGPTQSWNPPVPRSRLPEVRTGIREWARPQNSQLNLDLNRVYTAAPAPAAAPALSRQIIPHISVGGVDLEDTSLVMPATLSSNEATRRKFLLQRQLYFSRDNPPVLPPTQVPEAEARPNVPRQFSATVRAECMAQVGRTWNNKSAQRGRLIKKESRGNAEQLFVETAIENLWLRLRLATEGIDGAAE